MPHVSTSALVFHGMICVYDPSAAPRTLLAHGFHEFASPHCVARTVMNGIDGSKLTSARPCVRHFVTGKDHPAPITYRRRVYLGSQFVGLSFHSQQAPRQGRGAGGRDLLKAWWTGSRRQREEGGAGVGAEAFQAMPPGTSCSPPALTNSKSTVSAHNPVTLHKGYLESHETAGDM